MGCLVSHWRAASAVLWIPWRQRVLAPRQQVSTAHALPATLGIACLSCIRLQEVSLVDHGVKNSAETAGCEVPLHWFQRRLNLFSRQSSSPCAPSLTFLGGSSVFGQFGGPCHRNSSFVFSGPLSWVMSSGISVVSASLSAVALMAPRGQSVFQSHCWFVARARRTLCLSLRNLCGSISSLGQPHCGVMFKSWHS